MPGNGSYVVGGIARNGPEMVGDIAAEGTALSPLAAQLGVTKQATGQLIDALVERGYVLRSPDEQDRRRVLVTLTERGAAAAASVRGAVEDVDARLAGKVSGAALLEMRHVLGALAELDTFKHEPGRRRLTAQRSPSRLAICSAA